MSCDETVETQEKVAKQHRKSQLKKIRGLYIENIEKQ
jgi:hypothetical protein